MSSEEVKKARGGRRPKPDGTVMRNWTVRMPDGLLVVLRDESERTGQDMSEIAREAIIREMERRGICLTMNGTRLN